MEIKVRHRIPLTPPAKCHLRELLGQLMPDLALALDLEHDGCMIEIKRTDDHEHLSHDIVVVIRFKYSLLSRRKNSQAMLLATQIANLLTDEDGCSGVTVYVNFVMSFGEGGATTPVVKTEKEEEG